MKVGTGDVTRDKQSCDTWANERKQEYMTHSYEYDRSTFFADVPAVCHSTKHGTSEATRLLQHLKRRAMLHLESVAPRTSDHRVLCACLPQSGRGLLEHRRYGVQE